ncbi:MAG: hypothetical protein M3P41_11395, partial [Actinomycetota bacterium]|nr:hypothetical protein [Actinomycetota bacterium]
MEGGVGSLSEPERKRISRSSARWFPQVWASLVAGVRDEVAAETVVLVGAVAAALAEERLPDTFVLWLFENDREPADPTEALALCLEATDLWSVAEALAADRAVAAIPDDLDEDEHARRWDAVLEREAANLFDAMHGYT